MKRKLASLLMAVIMTLSLAAPAFATSYYWEYPDNASTDLTQSLTFAATTKVPTIALTMPVVGANPVILNPYQIEYTGDVTLNGVDNGAANSTDQTKQVISPVYAIKNDSDVPLKVSVKATTTISGDLKLATAAVTNADEKNKSAYVQIQFGVDTTGPIAATAASEQTIPAASHAAAMSGTTDTTITLKAGDVSLPTNTYISLPRPAVNGTTVTSNYLLFQFIGSAAKNPSPNAWTADDKFSTVMTFTFLPGGNASAATADVTLAASDTTASFDIDALNVSGTIADQTIQIALPTGAEGLVLDSTANASNFQVTPSASGTNGTAGNVGISLTNNTLTLTGADIKTVLTGTGVDEGTGAIVIKYKSNSTQATPDKTVTLTVNFTNVVQS